MTNNFIIKQIKMVSLFEYNLSSNKECTICRNNLNTQSIYNQDKGTESHVYKGACGHSFHQECISKWIIKNKICPICSDTWSPIFSYNNEKII